MLKKKLLKCSVTQTLLSLSEAIDTETTSHSFEM